MAAVQGLSVADFALLGSASLVTGAVAAVAAALTRPDMVASMTDLIATLQTLWLLFPEVRRVEHPVVCDTSGRTVVSTTSCGCSAFGWNVLFAGP
jgi:hypothetical protein